MLQVPFYSETAYGEQGISITILPVRIDNTLPRIQKTQFAPAIFLQQKSRVPFVITCQSIQTRNHRRRMYKEAFA